jgi:hypothetical protein
MTFDELKLCIAIVKADLGGADRPTTAQRLEAAGAVMLQWLRTFECSLFPWTVDAIESCRMRIRKNKDTQMKIEVAMTHGVSCFWSGRGKGPCTEEAECGHLVPRCAGGPLTVGNCVIECRGHNNQRREMTIEQYLNSPLTTEFSDVAL